MEEQDSGNKRVNHALAIYIKFAGSLVDEKNWWDLNYLRQVDFSKGVPAKCSKEFPLPEHRFIESASLITIPRYPFKPLPAEGYGLSLRFKMDEPENLLLDGGPWLLGRTFWSFIFSENGDYDPSTYYFDEVGSHDRLMKRIEEDKEFSDRVPRSKPLKWAGESNFMKMEPADELRLKTLAFETLAELSKEYPDKFPDFGQFLYDSEPQDTIIS